MDMAIDEGRRQVVSLEIERFARFLVVADTGHAAVANCHVDLFDLAGSDVHHSRIAQQEIGRLLLLSYPQKTTPRLNHSDCLPSSAGYSTSRRSSNAMTSFSIRSCSRANAPT